MEQYIAFLRGINVGGKRIIKMVDLKMLFAELNFEQVASYIQSGNILFYSNNTSVERLETQIKKAINVKFGFEVPVIVRRADEVGIIIHENPFLSEHVDEKTLHLTLLSNLPEKNAIEQLIKKDMGEEEFQITGKNIYLKCMEPYHKSKLSNVFFEKGLGVKVTTRNWKTLQKINELIHRNKE